MRVRKAAIVFLASPLILLAQAMVTLVILRRLGGEEWMAPNIFYFLLIYPVAHGVFHWVQDNANEALGQKVAFGKVQVSKRLCVTLVIYLIVLACCVFAALIIQVELRTMMAPVMIVTVVLVNEGISYQGLRFVNWLLGRSRNTNGNPEAKA